MFMMRSPVTRAEQKVTPGRVEARWPAYNDSPVIPAKAGTSGRPAETSRPEVPAFAGMTEGHQIFQPL